MDGFAASMAYCELIEIGARSLIMTDGLIEEGPLSLIVQPGEQGSDRRLDIASQTHRQRTRLPSFLARISICTILASVG